MTGTNDRQDAAPRKGTFLQTVKAILWAFFGVRKSSGYEKDVNELKPAHVIIGGLVGALIFIVLLILIVNWVVGSGAAT
ncbi:DUF2970 domain-containing protein [Caldimonas thermodepolymerans]|jgi:Protein of unknown function (DUF2970).|uniref:Uncharacterized protein n=1 Tax=Caldimonas thermodepolymerans TaxID=215580 RepID=A0A2S5T3S1_9BURK|nr:DUF2970 domain-containing protein [Caldimonas thermodepolymerans]PPE69579.1 hypothetical protein C1702_11635 [Caldimonas thermodepolymerans]QPC30906.1 DUF2970 domain-containing protein [Caldimonas thermodepolymerans]RDH97088.1 DUF2970 family protein [Caldimonas thermodepolymerans]